MPEQTDPFVFVHNDGDEERDPNPAVTCALSELYASIIEGMPHESVPEEERDAS